MNDDKRRQKIDREWTRIMTKFIRAVQRDINSLATAKLSLLGL